MGSSRSTSNLLFTVISKTDLPCPDGCWTADFGKASWKRSPDSWEVATIRESCVGTMNRGEIHHGDTEAPSHQRTVLFLRASVPLWWKPGSWRAALAQAPCSRTMNPGFRGARRPPLRQAGRPPLQTRGSWEDSRPGVGADAQENVNLWQPRRSLRSEGRAGWRGCVAKDEDSAVRRGPGLAFHR